MSIATNKKKVLFRGFGKRMRASLEMKPKTAMSPADAVKALRAFKAPKFDQTVNVVVNLGIDPKAADQALRGSIAMPHGIGHCVIGKMSFKDEQLVANLSHFIATIEKARPASVKGTYLKKCVVSAAMSPGVLVSA